eukprot:gene46276-57092_t
MVADLCDLVKGLLKPLGDEAKAEWNREKEAGIRDAQ